MTEVSEMVLERAKVREVAGVLRSREALDAAVDALLLKGFDRADIDVLADVEAVRRRLGTTYIAAEDLADIPLAPREPFVAHHEIAVALGLAVGVLTFVAGAIAAFIVIYSEGSSQQAVAATIVGTVLAGSIGAFFVIRFLRRQREKEIEARMTIGGFILWVRVRSAEHEAKAQEILHQHGAEAIRIHEVGIGKYVDDLPLSSLRPDRWLGDERLGRP